MKKTLLIGSLLFLGACETYTPQRYAVSADTNMALRALASRDVGVGSFTRTADFNNRCRLAGPIGLPDGLSFETYIQKALADELKMAGMFVPTNPPVTLTGTVEKLSFLSSQNGNNGVWHIDLRVTSTNGKSVLVSESYEFKSGFGAEIACKQTAEAYLPAVQNLIRKLVTDPQFGTLIGV